MGPWHLDPQEWRKSSFSARRRLLKVLLKFIVENQEPICRVSARDSGKPLLHAIVGEIMVTCEKIHWLCKEGEHYLRPEKRSAGILVSHACMHASRLPQG